MTPKEFNKILESRISIMRLSLVQKATEYAPGADRLHNFKVAAALKSESPAAALWGMNVKHIVSITDMVADPRAFSRDQWMEKIKDYMNYGVLLEAVVAEAFDEA